MAEAYVSDQIFGTIQAGRSSEAVHTAWNSIFSDIQILNTKVFPIFRNVGEFAWEQDPMKKVNKFKSHKLIQQSIHMH